MSLNPTLTVLSTLTAHQVQHLLMGGQACMLYGAVQFSRDTDIAVLAEPSNLDRLRAALEELQAICVAVPPFELKYLERGQAVHFRCQRTDVANMRIDVMSKMRGVDDFQDLWARRTTMQLEDGAVIELMGLADLVQAKKTQRLKDWPMLVRLIETDYTRKRNESPSDKQVEFWLTECRLAATLCELVKRFPDEAGSLVNARPLLRHAIAGNIANLDDAILQEWNAQREVDIQYWQPLKADLEQIRMQRRKS